jgi:hypothetical protein
MTSQFDFTARRRSQKAGIPISRTPVQKSELPNNKLQNPHRMEVNGSK